MMELKVCKQDNVSYTRKHSYSDFITPIGNSDIFSITDSLSLKKLIQPRMKERLVVYLS